MGMNNDKIFARIKSLITRKLDIVVPENPLVAEALSEVTMETTFDDLKVDSIEFLEIVLALEKDFNITIKDEEILKIANMQELVKYIEKKLSLNVN